MKNIRYFVVVAASFALLSACQNTVQGFGQDLEKAGEKIQGKKTTSSVNSVQPAAGSAYSTNSTTYNSGTTYSTSPTYGDVY